MKVEAFMRKLFKAENERDGIIVSGVGAAGNSGSNAVKSRRFGMDDSVFIRRIWYDTIYARRHK